jgi:hypothetical protein
MLKLNELTFFCQNFTSDSHLFTDISCHLKFFSFYGSGVVGLILTMNQLIPITTEYLTPSKTIEILNLARFEESKQVYVYNYEGTHFRVFENLLELIQLFELGKEPAYSFNIEDDLDDFLENLPLNPYKRPLNLKLNYMYRDGVNYKPWRA